MELEVYVDGALSQTVPLGPGRTVVGRGRDNEVVLADPGLGLSRHHVELVASPDGIRARDLGSKNGTRLGETKLHGEVQLRDGDALALGDRVLLKLRVDADRGSASLSALARAAAALGDDPLAQELRALERSLHAEGEALRWVRSVLPGLSADTTRERMRAVVEAVGALTAASVWALVWDAGGPRRSGITYRHLVHDGAPRDLPHPRSISSSVVGGVLRTGRPTWLDDATADPDFADARSVLSAGLKSVGCLPLGPTAVLYLVRSDSPAAFGPEIRARVELLCALAGPLTTSAPAEPPPADVVPALLPGLVGRSRAVLGVCEEARTWAPLPFPVLLLGERGTGKSHLAKALHELSGATGRFVHVDCPTHLRGDGAASALFGHERGAFTGAIERRVGYAEEASEGTLFLDEIGELSDDVQAMLLNLIQEERFRRVGGDRDLPFRGRVIAATNRPVDADAGRFRRDLYDRLDVVVLRMPALSERLEDVPLLADHFLAQETGRLVARGLSPPQRFTPRAASALMATDLSGNVRSLRSAVVRALGRAMRQGAREILPEHVDVGPGEPVGVEAAAASEGSTYRELVQTFERQVLERALAAAGGNQRQAARALGLSNQAWHRARERVGFRPHESREGP